MPTIRQKQAFDKLTEKHGAISIGEAMLQAGYDEDTAKKPKNLTESKGWQELMQTYLPDDKLAERHRELLDKREVFLIEKDDDGRKIYEHLDQPDTQAVSKALDLAYKLKGSYAPDKSINLEARVTGDIKDWGRYQALTNDFEQKLLDEYAQT